VAPLLSQLEQLCSSCARCCNGSVYGATTLEPAEEQRFGCRALPQPCPHLVERRCSIYASRPRACAAFLCPLALALERGLVTLEAARARLVTSPGLPQ